VLGVERNTKNRTFTIPIEVKMSFPSKQTLIAAGEQTAFNNTFSADVGAHGMNG
jgi:hypothetical protein